MTETILPVTEQIDTQQLAQQLVERARAEGVDLVGTRRVKPQAKYDNTW